MTDSSRRDRLSMELCRHIEDQLCQLVMTGEIKVPRGTRLRVDSRGNVKVADRPIPTISRQRISQILDHIKSNLFDRSQEWSALWAELEFVAVDGMQGRRFYHEQVLKRIECTQQAVVGDFQAFMDLARDLSDSPGHIKDVEFPGILPQLVARMLGVASRRRDCDYDEAARLMVILEDNHLDIFLSVNKIFELHRRAKAQPDDAGRLGALAVQCFSGLVMTFKSKDPRNDMDHQVFRSLQERISEVRRGHRAPSPGVDEDDRNDGFDVDFDVDSE
ncbi:hypothetical protein MRS44_001394 [Fusarium solani]|uniref:Uncharacterized protein n=1 Tax=Fusarium solani TaxID=169388 RepID=A0A9P9L4A9_FUSSL|nr:uncharacterized protein B0J15DRAFT_567055 [Fusarium solani]KAH7273723.1 hypothetical protein B0J15DRAFT_567055 [Fusarium solani]KAJ3471295.1 hypothetical protein MRS44_001394 [Fusarium solani]